MKKYRKNNTEVEAIQYKGTEKSIEEIRELLPKEAHFSKEYSLDHKYKRFDILCRPDYKSIFETDWIVKDGKYFFVVSNDIFVEMFSEVENE